MHQTVQSLQHKVQALPAQPVNLEPITQSLHEVKQKTESLIQRFNDQVEPRQIEELKEAINLITSSITQFQSQIEQLTQQIQDLPPPFNPSLLEQRIAEQEQSDRTMIAEYNCLTQLLQAEIARVQQSIVSIQNRTVTAVAEVSQHFSGEIESLRATVHALPTPNEPVDLSEIEAAITNDLHDYARQLKNEAQQRIDQIHLATVELDERIQKFVQMPEQLEAVEQLFAELDEKTTALDERTHNLTQTVQRLSFRLHERTGHLDNMLTSLRQLVTECVKTGDFQGVLSTLSEQITGQVDTAVEQRLAGINQLLKEILPQYEYKLVYDRRESRACVLKAVRESQERLILVCPWLHWGILWNNEELLSYLHVILQERNGFIDIGWGHRSEINSHQIRDLSGSIRTRLKAHFKPKYDALNYLENLERDYHNQFKLKLLGTHEKFLVCDRSWAMLGSHNFLSSGDNSNERELGLLTNDPRIVANLISRFDSAKDWEKKEEIYIANN